MRIMILRIGRGLSMSGRQDALTLIEQRIAAPFVSVNLTAEIGSTLVSPIAIKYGSTKIGFSTREQIASSVPDETTGTREGA